MNRDRIEGHWRQFAGKVEEKWGQLTGDELMTMDGKRMRHAGKLQKHYGYAKDQVHKKFGKFAKRLKS